MLRSHDQKSVVSRPSLCYAAAGIGASSELARGRYRALERLDVGRAVHDLIANDDARSAVDRQRSSKLEIVAQHGIDLRRSYIRLHPVDIEPDRARDLDDNLLVDFRLSGRPQHGPMERVILALLLRGERNPRCKD